MQDFGTQETNIPTKDNTYYKKHKDPFRVGISTVVIIVLICILPGVIHNVILTNRVQSYIEPNTWYTYDGGPLHIQNCLVESAISVRQGRAMMVQYHAVCQHCHSIDESSKFAGPEVNYEVKKVHYCNECGGQTLVRIIIG